MSTTEAIEMSPSHCSPVKAELYSQIRAIRLQQHHTMKIDKAELLQIIHSAGKKLEVILTKIHLQYYLEAARRFEGLLNYLKAAFSREERKDVRAFVEWNKLPSEADRRLMLVQWGINHIEECAGAMIISKKFHEFLSTYIPEEIELITESDMIHNKLFTTTGDTRSYEHEKVGNCVLETEAVADDDSNRSCCCDDNNDIRESEPLITKGVVYKKQGGEVINSTYPWPFSFWTALSAAKNTKKLN
jgi:hypothetical protein